jgi:abequosyltransferase
MNPTTDTAGAVPRLSICIATFKRGAYIAETLASIVEQLDEHVELVVVDGASPDNTAAVVAPYVSRHDRVRYFRESVNSGVDADYDKAVGYARGAYCWLMTDDDLMVPGAVSRVLSALTDEPELLVVNAQVLNADFSSVLTDRCLPFDADREYRDDDEAFFADAANYLSFIGGVVVRRELWLQRARSPYYGTAFIHIGVLFQQRIVGRIKALSEPLIRIRYGNAMWTARGFEIWMFSWPRLIWGFDGYSDRAKARVYLREPWKKARRLLLARAVGSYSENEYRQWLIGRAHGPYAAQARLIASMPGTWANLISAVYALLFMPGNKILAYDLARSRYSTWVSRLAARRLRIRW